MKKIWPIILACLLCVSCASPGNDSSQKTETKASVASVDKKKETPAPTETVKETETPAPTETVKETETPAPTETVKETETPAPTEAVEETETPAPIETVEEITDSDITEAAPSESERNSASQDSSYSGNSVTVPGQEESEGNLVWVPVNGGTKYHRSSSCSNMKDPMQVTVETAIANGYEPCKKCY